MLLLVMVSHNIVYFPLDAKYSNDEQFGVLIMVESRQDLQNWISNIILMDFFVTMAAVYAITQN